MSAKSAPPSITSTTAEIAFRLLFDPHDWQHCFICIRYRRTQRKKRSKDRLSKQDYRQLMCYSLVQLPTSIYTQNCPPAGSGAIREDTCTRHTFDKLERLWYVRAQLFLGNQLSRMCGWKWSPVDPVSGLDDVFLPLFIHGMHAIPTSSAAGSFRTAAKEWFLGGKWSHRCFPLRIKSTHCCITTSFVEPLWITFVSLHCLSDDNEDCSPPSSSGWNGTQLQRADLHIYLMHPHYKKFGKWHCSWW